jgi:hypothetical protein
MPNSRSASRLKSRVPPQRKLRLREIGGLMAFICLGAGALSAFKFGGIWSAVSWLSPLIAVAIWQTFQSLSGKVPISEEVNPNSTPVKLCPKSMTLPHFLRR